MTAISRAFNALPAVIRGPIWMILGGLSLILLAIVIRHLQNRYHVLEMIFLRSVVSLLLILPWAVRQHRAELTTRRLPLHIFRNSIHYLGNIGWFIGVITVSLADLQALQFTVPLFTIIMAAIFLRESVGSHRWIATALGFIGALVIIRPGIIEIGIGTIAVVLSAMFYAASQTSTKSLSRTDTPNAILLYMALIFVPISAIPVFIPLSVFQTVFPPWVITTFFPLITSADTILWVTPSWDDALPVVLLGVFGYLAHACIIRSFATADASFVMPFDFLRLPFAALFGFVLYQEIPEIWVWIGATIIFFATYYITWRENRLRQQRSDT
ncbi:MAG: DMT family transporter [Rhodospirillaceae bacterium]|jgi:drug/metabolite transporter (DMT)-like permease|nr:DMT family transporter [Rhodospirillaceae bacterium]